MGPCFHCKKTGHLIADCPLLQATTSKNVHMKKKAMVDTWDGSETDSEEVIDAAYVCFMTNKEETSMVNLETSLENNDLTMNKLTQFFEELQNRYEMSFAQNKKLKKENDFLKNKLEIVVKEKNDLSISFEKMKKNFDKHKLVCKGKNPNITYNKNEFLDIQ